MFLINEIDKEQCTRDSIDVDDVYATSNRSTKEGATYKSIYILD